jgi:GxxExxY protein
MTVHNNLGAGFLESVYQNALIVELRRSGISVECEKRIQVIYEGVLVGDYTADMIVEGLVIIENKAVSKLLVIHEVQLVNYLAATGLEAGLLLDFGRERLEFKRKNLTYRPPGAYAEVE